METHKMTLKKYSTCALIGTLVFFTACKKGDIVTETPVTAPVTTPVTSPVTTTPVSDVPANATIVEVGTGSGTLTIDGSTLKITNNVLVKIKGGTYTSIVIRNISASALTPVFVKNNGEVKITGSMETDNISNVKISGDYTAGLTYGFKFQDIAYRAIAMNGVMNGVTLSYMSFQNVSNYVIAGDAANGDNLTYTGSAATRTEGFKILHCLFDNVGSIVFGGELNKDNGKDTGFFKDVEIAYNTFQNSATVGSACSFTNVQDYNIHHNTVNNINTANNNHNGVFFMQGNGLFHDNKLTNYQGNSIRMWLYSRGSTPATNEIYNNICYNTRKYSGFELQSFDRNMYAGKSTFANAKVYNNTVGTMNTTKDWEGQLLDLYNIGGTLQYYNNLGFNLYTNNTITDMINNMSTTNITVKTNNQYFASQQDAVFNTSTFASKVPGDGATAL